MTTRKVTFSNSANEPLAALLDLPVGREPSAYAIFAHCFTCSKNIKAAAFVSRTLAREGIAVLRFDFTGLGESSGVFADSNFSSNVDDLLMAAAFLDREHQSPALLIGHSLGGAAAIEAAARLESVRAVITIATPSDPAHVVKQFGPQRNEILAAGEAEVAIGGQPFRVKKQFLDDVGNHRLEKTLAGLRKALLIMHSPVDQVVSIEHAAALFKAAKHPKSFISLETADHLLSKEPDAVYTGRMAAAWASRFLGLQRLNQDADHQDNRVVARIEEGFRTEIIANGHSLIADEPVASGGTNSGPSPYDLLVAGVGACTAMTLRMYADHKKLPLEAVNVTLNHRKIHAADCQTCETKEGKIDRIERSIEMIGELTDEQRRRMVEIADRCPVHRTLHSEVEIVTRLVE